MAQPPPAEADTISQNLMISVERRWQRVLDLLQVIECWIAEMAGKNLTGEDLWETS